MKASFNIKSTIINVLMQTLVIVLFGFIFANTLSAGKVKGGSNSNLSKESPSNSEPNNNPKKNYQDYFVFLNDYHIDASCPKATKAYNELQEATATASEKGINTLKKLLGEFEKEAAGCVKDKDNNTVEVSIISKKFEDAIEKIKEDATPIPPQKTNPQNYNTKSEQKPSNNSASSMEIAFYILIASLFGILFIILYRLSDKVRKLKEKYNSIYLERNGNYPPKSNQNFSISDNSIRELEKRVTELEKRQEKVEKDTIDEIYNLKDKFLTLEKQINNLEPRAEEVFEKYLKGGLSEELGYISTRAERNFFDLERKNKFEAEFSISKITKNHGYLIGNMDAILLLYCEIEGKKDNSKTMIEVIEPGKAKQKSTNEWEVIKKAKIRLK